MCGDGCNLQEADVLACSFQSWYSRFERVTFRSAAIALPEPFVQYLLADGVRLPPQLVDAPAAASESDGSEWGDGGSDSGEDDGEREQVFKDVAEAVRLAIEALGGAVLPKLNWSAPKDAKWVLGTLKCQSAQDVFTLLKSSDFIAHDLCHSFDHCADRSDGGRSRPDTVYLVLRQWQELNEANEFRCFVRDKQLLAVSQRHTSAFLPHLADSGFTDAVVRNVQDFFTTCVSPNFPLGRYAFDVLVGRPGQHKVHLVDFSPWAPSTDPLLLEWSELAELPSSGGTLPEFRAVRSEAETRTKLENYHSLPLEVAELGVTSAEEMEELCRRAGAK